MKRKFVIAAVALAGFFLAAGAGFAIALCLPVEVKAECDHYEDYPFAPYLTFGLGAAGAFITGLVARRRLRRETARPVSA